jgi:hypothetical protein
MMAKYLRIWLFQPKEDITPYELSLLLLNANQNVLDEPGAIRGFSFDAFFTREGTPGSVLRWPAIDRHFTEHGKRDR